MFIFDAIPTIAPVRLGAPPIAFHPLSHSQTYFVPLWFPNAAMLQSSVWEHDACLLSLVRLGTWLRPLRMIKLVVVCVLPLSCVWSGILIRLSPFFRLFLDAHTHAILPPMMMILLSVSAFLDSVLQIGRSKSPIAGLSQYLFLWQFARGTPLLCVFCDNLETWHLLQPWYRTFWA